MNLIYLNMNLVSFCIGLFVGFVIGIVIMGCLYIGRQEDENKKG